MLYETFNRAPNTTSIVFKKIIVFKVMNMYLLGLFIYLSVTSIDIYTHIVKLSMPRNKKD